MNSGSRGRPRVEVHHAQLRLMHSKGCTAVQMARQLCCSTSLVYKKLSMENLQLRQKFTNIDDAILDDNVRSLHDTHSHAGVEVRVKNIRGVNENLGYETETFPQFCETETLDFLFKTRPRPCRPRRSSRPFGLCDYGELSMQYEFMGAG